ncbi:MAG TPA: alpha-1,4-glucan--maltose-1-phosphate maltosyltransferase [Candidatus Binatia bacterium]
MSISRREHRGLTVKPFQRGEVRVIIEGVKPEVDDGRYPAKRVVGDVLVVEADIFTDGQDSLSAVLQYRKESEGEWRAVPMHHVANDRWRGEFPLSEIGRYRYTLKAWVDRFKTWRQSLIKKVGAKQDVALEILEGADLLEEAGQRASMRDQKKLQDYASDLRSEKAGAMERALDEGLSTLMGIYPDERFPTTYGKELAVVVDREKARFSSWYEMFPRSCSSEPGKHGTFKDCERRLRYVSAMGFDVLYMPPIHPIGASRRKGKNNVLEPASEDPGSPWAIGSRDGGHKAVHPLLGTLVDFKRLLKKARELGVEVALDLAFQCNPDHPYVKEHPEWFRTRPDGTIQHAENPPKKYQDIYPLDFNGARWREVWDEMASIVLFWIEQGVRIFRVDNPHTKPFNFWEDLISGIQKDYPEAIFLAEAFTRPGVMHHLAKLGFSQSYTYFAWRNTKWELTQYFSEITRTDVREFFRPNLWPNTPDILTEYLQSGGRAAFMTRLILAATLGANYGIYGPAFELCESQAMEPGSEEYLNSEKYEIKDWDIKSPQSLRELIAKVNRIRRENAALQSDWSLQFHPVDNERMICYSKQTEDLKNIILMVVNLDPYHTQSGWLELPFEFLGTGSQQAYQVHDLLTDSRYMWQGPRNYVEIQPNAVPAQILRIERRTRTERDFDYFM